MDLLGDGPLKPWTWNTIEVKQSGVWAQVSCAANMVNLCTCKERFCGVTAMGLWPGANLAAQGRQAQPYSGAKSRASDAAVSWHHRLSPCGSARYTSPAGTGK